MQTTRQQRRGLRRQAEAAHRPAVRQERVMKLNLQGNSS